jgi:hypothetical protein
MAFTIKQSDTSPSILANLQDSNGTAINLNGASVRFHMKAVGGAVVIDEPMTIVNAAGGIVRYDWQTGDTDVPGTYYVEFEATYSDNTIETFPNNTNETVLVIPQLN